MSKALVRKRIVSQQALETFLNSPTHDDLVAFIDALNTACTDKTLREACPEGPVRTKESH
jgi:hypothetical protein